MNNSATSQAQRIADESTAPTNLVAAFSQPGTYEAGLSLGDLDPGEVRAIWVRRLAANTVAQADDGVSIQIRGGTAG